jgi:uncharacterized protein (DUF2236 family)
LAVAAGLFPTDEQLDEIIVGPGSVSWSRTSDMRLQLAMLYPLLLQVAHPTVAAGVRDFSDFEHQPWERLQRTVDYVSVLVYGGREAAAAGRRLRLMHRRFRGVREDGQRYSALEPSAYAWVHATLIDTYVAGHRQFGNPLSAEELGRFYREYRQLGRLIGVRERDLPASWEGFREYFERMCAEQLRRSDSFDRVLDSLRNVPTPPLPLPAVVWPLLRIPTSSAAMIGGLGLMSPELRTRLGVSWSWLDETRFRALGALARALGPVMPEGLRVTGPAQLRWRREQIARELLAQRC